MIFVGIDVAKSHHDIAMIDDSGTIILQHLKIQNNFSGFATLQSKLNELAIGQSIYIAMEATGHYSLNILMFLQSLGYPTIAYNPFLIKEFIKATSLRKTKTDRADAISIAKKLASDTAPEVFTISKEMQELKFLSRHRNRLTARRAELKGQYVRLLDISFPELVSIIGKNNLHAHYVSGLLIKYPSHTKLARCKITSLINIIHIKHGNQFEYSQKIKTLAKHSIGLESKANELELIQTINMIQLLSTQILEVDQEINRLMITMEDAHIITSIAGISNRLGSVILAEINNIHNFKSAEQLLAFAGLEPSIYQSGQVNATGKMVKRGSAALRWALIQAAEYATRWSPTMRAYLHKKRDEGNIILYQYHTLLKSLSELFFICSLII